jgi:hypothetical protein
MFMYVCIRMRTPCMTHERARPYVSCVCVCVCVCVFVCERECRIMALQRERTQRVKFEVERLVGASAM